MNPPAASSENLSNLLNFSGPSSRNVTFDLVECQVPLAMVFALALIYGAVIILGLSGNLALIIIILKQKEMRNVTNILIVNLSFSDLLVTIMCLPFTLVYTLMDHWIFGEAMCKMNQFVQCISVTVSVFSLVLIAIERHQLIINPRGWRPNNRHACIGIAVIWVLAFVSSLPFMMYQVLTDDPFENVTIENWKGNFVCIDEFPSETLRLSFTTTLGVIQYFGPLCFIFICYLKIEQTRGGTKNTQPEEKPNEEQEQVAQWTVKEGDNVLLRNFNHRWNSPRFTGPHQVEKTAPRAVKLRDKNVCSYLHDIKP